MIQKRLRLKKSEKVEEGYALVNENLFKMLELQGKEELEVVVSKKKFRFKIKKGTTEEDKVYLSKQEMEKKGLSDNTIATVRGA